jgi:hypothetical protein
MTHLCFLLFLIDFKCAVFQLNSTVNKTGEVGQSSKVANDADDESDDDDDDDDYDELLARVQNLGMQEKK